MKMLKILLFTLVFASLGLAANAQQSSLGDTLGAFNAGILTPTPDRGLSGLAFIDGHYYLSGFDPDGGYVSKIYKISGDGQQLISFWSYPGLIGGIKGLAYDGDFLYGAGMNAIYQINFQTGMVTDTIPSPLYYASGLVYDPETDHFWVSGDGNQLYEIDRNGNILNIISFINDLPTAGLAWDSWTVGGPYLWVWSMLYEPDVVHPKAYQIKASTGQLTGVTFEGISTSPFGTDQALSLCLSDEIVEGKVSFAALHGSNFQSQFDGLDWVVLYDLDPEGTGVPGPILNVDPTYLQNNLIFNDSIEVDINIFNLAAEYSLNWLALLEYPENETNPPGEVLQQFNGTELASPFTENALKSVVFLDDHIYIAARPGPGSEAFLLKITNNGSAIVEAIPLYFSPYGGTALATDGTYLYATATYVILKFDPQTFEVVETIPKTNFSATAMAVDQQSNLIYLAGNSVIKVINFQGEEVNFYVTPYSINGLAWDNWSPGAPFLWVSTMGVNGPEVYRIHPSTGLQTGLSFEGTNFNTNDSLTDMASDIFVTPDWQQNKLVIIALQKSTDNGGQLNDQVVVYDLATVPPPGWIEIVGISTGTIAPGQTEILTVKLKAIMEDTLMTANIVINNNSVVNPRLVVPVAFFMEADGTAVGILENPLASDKLVSNIYPNPADDKLIIRINQQAENFKVDLYSSLGMLVKSYSLPAKEQLTLDVSALKQGIYMLVINDGIISEQHKLIIR